jgi:two-component system, OmpR family, sensor kinase
LKTLHPRRWPVRWRIAGVSAGLTLLILLVFAMVVGRLTTDRIRNDFNDDLEQTANEISLTSQAAAMQALQKAYTTPGAEIRFVDANGQVALVPSTGQPAQTPGAPDLGQPVVGDVVGVGRYQVASAPSLTSTTGEQLYVQYARPDTSVDSTINRLWLLLGIGVLGGTVLAALAGMAVAQRAMRPIANLTAAARTVAKTRDPSQRIPMPESDDEVAELAATLDEMLRELDAARDETQQMMQAQRDFVADASHELRTPLTSILANLELLEERLEAEAESEEAEMVAGALGSSRRMRRLVADLLLLARADAGRSGPRRPCNLRAIAEAAIAEVTVVAPSHLLTLESDGRATVDGDRDELHRLVLNLLENGVRHTPPGSRIEVTISSGDGSVVLDVSDDGPGLPSGPEDQLFGRFVRGNGPSDLMPDSGTGLGLAIVKAVATAHGGDVVAGRSPAGGARFTVTLPASSESLASVYTPG